MAKIETTFIRPKELYTPETGETKVVYDGYQNNPHELITEDGFAGALDTAMPTALAKAQVIETTWQELKDKRDNGQLIAGSLYRITDYNCTTTQENTRSAGHQFDIVLLALSENKLAEEGWAMMNEGNVYDVTFSDGVTKKCWLYDPQGNEEYDIVACDNLLGISGLIEGEGEDFILNESNKTITMIGINSTTGMAMENLPYNYFQNSNLSAWKVWYCLDNDTARFAWADDSVGRGVIYRLIDEFNNDIKYDFKNIQFVRKLTDGEYDPDSGEDTWVHTFTWLDEYGVALDASVVAQNITNDEGGCTGCHDNVIGACSAYGMGITGNTFVFALNDIVFISAYSYEDGIYYGCYGNKFGADCHSNTFGNGCYSNSFGNGCNYNTFGNGCNSNSFGNECYSNSFGNECNSNSFGNKIYRNTFGNEIYRNTFGNGCNSNSFGNGCNYNTFGNYFQNNSFGDGCYSNSFGNGCNYNSFGNECYSNSFGNNVFQVKFLKDYTRFVIVENGNNYISLTSNKTTSSSAYLQNIMFALGANNVNQESDRRTISHNSVNDKFKTTYQSEDSVTVNVEDL